MSTGPVVEETPTNKSVIQYWLQILLFFEVTFDNVMRSFTKNHFNGMLYCWCFLHGGKAFTGEISFWIWIFFFSSGDCCIIHLALNKSGDNTPQSKGKWILLANYICHSFRGEHLQGKLHHPLFSLDPGFYLLSHDWLSRSPVIITFDTKLLIFVESAEEWW